MIYPLNAKPTIAAQSPSISDVTNVGEYAIDLEDNVMKRNTTPPGFFKLKASTVDFSHDVLPATHNPIGRELKILSSIEDNRIQIVSNRSKMQLLLNCFLFEPNNYHHPTKDCLFIVARKGNTLYFGDPDVEPGPKMFEDIAPQGYGIQFQNLATKAADPQLFKYLRYNQFTLLNRIHLIVRIELDCVDKGGNNLEIKTKLASKNPRYPPHKDASYMLKNWGKMFLGQEDYLYLGILERTKPENQRARIESATAYSFAQVREHAQLDDRTERLVMARLASLLQWVIDHVQDTDRMVLTYHKEAGKFSLVTEAEAVAAGAVL